MTIQFTAEERKEIDSFCVDFNVNAHTIHAVDEETGLRLIHMAAYRGVGAVKFILSQGADVDAVDSNHGATALHGAVLLGNVEVAKVLVANGADVFAINKHGQTPLDLAKQQDNMAMVQYLVAAQPEATSRVKRAAEQGDIKAEYTLACRYLQGLGTDKDFVQGRKWLESAAEKGFVEAQTLLGTCLHAAINGFQKNTVQAVHWYKKAAEQGDTSAMLGLSTCYIQGDGVEKDMTQALYLLKKAADNGNEHAKETLQMFNQMPPEMRAMMER